MKLNTMTTAQISLRDLAARLGCELKGDGDIEITGVAGMEQAGPTELTFLANPKYAPKVKHTPRGRDSGVRAAARRPRPPAWFPPTRITISRARWRCSISRRGPQPGIHPQASIAPRRAHRRRRLHRALSPWSASTSPSAATPFCIRTW